MKITIKTAALMLAAPGLALAVPAAAAPASHAAPSAHAAYGDLTYQNGDRGRHRGWDKQRGRHDRYQRDRYERDRYARADRYRSQSQYYGEPVYANTRVWRGEDNRYYCRRSNGTTGLLIGGAAGALLGREIAGRGDRTLGAILGAAGGALLGREVDRGGSRCR